MKKKGYKVQFTNVLIGDKTDYFFSNSRGMTPHQLAKERVKFLKGNKFADHIRMSPATQIIGEATAIDII